MKTLTVLEASASAAFRFRLEGGMDERDRDELEAMDSGYVLGPDWPSIVSDSVDVRHRIHYMKRRNLGFGYIGARDPDFEERLKSVDPDLPRILGSIVADLYLNGTRMLIDHAENIEAETPRGRGRGWCGPLLQRLILSFGSDAPLERCFVYRMPAGFEGNFEIEGNRMKGFTTALVFGIGYEG